MKPTVPNSCAPSQTLSERAGRTLIGSKDRHAASPTPKIQPPSKANLKHVTGGRGKYAKYHKILGDLSKGPNGVLLDFETRQQVIRELRDIDCLSDIDDEEETNPSDHGHSPTRTLTATEIRFKIDSIKNFLARPDPVYRMPDAVGWEKLNARSNARQHAVSKAVNFMIERKRKKDAELNSTMLSFLRDSASAANQQARRLAIGVVSRAVTRARTKIVEDSLAQRELAIERRRVAVEAVKTIHRGWRTSRSKHFLRNISSLVHKHRAAQFKVALKAEYDYKRRIGLRAREEDEEVAQWQQREADCRAYVHEKSQGEYVPKVLRPEVADKAALEHEFRRPDLAPFSTQIVSIIEQTSSVLDNPVQTWFDRAFISQQYKESLSQPKSESAVCKVLDNLLKMSDSELRGQSLTRKGPLMS